tara:strand:- start:6275 stop:6736 length:462 start_codon:yes stop_codon:yes gene_type:complete
MQKTDNQWTNVYEQLAEDEGIVLEIYNDHLGYATFGIGHLITEDDPEYGQEVGTPVSEERVRECFDNDIVIADGECVGLYGIELWSDLPQEVREILINMMFNMGRPRLSKFKKMNAWIEQRNWINAAAEGRDSRWYQQVPNRAERLMNRLEVV